MKPCLWGWGLLLLMVGSCGPATPSAPTEGPSPVVTFFEGTPRETQALVYRFDLDTATLDLIDGHKRRFAQIAASQPHAYRVLMNAGMFHPNGDPVGLFLNDSVRHPLNEDRDRRGNFFLHPNGVFFVNTEGVARICTTPAFEVLRSHFEPFHLATQSGPMLLIEGAYHPAFNPNSTNRHIRNGVGLTNSQTLVFIKSEEPITFHAFASMFLEQGCVDALYLDGAISGLYIAGTGVPLSSFKVAYGPVLGIRAE